MPLNYPLFINDDALNGDSGIEVWSTREHQPVAARTSYRTRSRQIPVISDVSFEPRKATFSIRRSATWTGTQLEFEETVWNLFRPDGNLHVLQADRDGELWQVVIYITSFDQEDPHQFTCKYEELDMAWESVAEFQSAVPDDLEIAGNIETQAEYTITGGVAVTHRRLSVISPRPISAYPVAVNIAGLSSTNHYAFMYGERVPFSYAGGWLYFRVDTEYIAEIHSHRAFVDIYSSAGLNNDIDGNAFDPAGLTLTSAINSGTILADPTVAPDNPTSPVFTWVPTRTYKHRQDAPYTYGQRGGYTRMVDQQDTGIVESLENDADGIVLTAPLGVSNISNIDVDVFVGRKPGVAVIDQQNTTEDRVMRVVMTNFDKSVDWGATELFHALNGGHNYPWYTQWRFGMTTFPHTFSRQLTDPNRGVDLGGQGVSEEGGDPGGVQGTGYDSLTAWYRVTTPSSFQSMVEDWIGCQVTTGSTGIYYLHFPAGSYYGIEIPLLSMSITPRDADYQTDVDLINGGTKTLINYANPNAGPMPAILFQAEWVDPDTLEPADEEDGDPRLTGMTRLSIVYRTEENEDFQVAWTRKLTSIFDLEGSVVAPVPGASLVREATSADSYRGDEDVVGVVYEFRNIAVAIPDAVQVGIRLEPAATKEHEINWGEFTILDTPQITLSEVPALSVDQANAQYVDGILTNVTTGEHIELVDCFSPDTGLVLDTTNRNEYEVIRPVNDAGIVYGGVHASSRSLWLPLHLGTNSLQVSGGLTTATIAATWRKRLRVNT